MTSETMNLNRWRQLLSMIDRALMPPYPEKPMATPEAVQGAKDTIFGWVEIQKECSPYPTKEPICAHCGSGPLDVDAELDTINRTLVIKINCSFCGWVGP